MVLSGRLLGTSKGALLPALRFAVALLMATGGCEAGLGQRAIASGELDPAREVRQLHTLRRADLKEQYVWTANDAAALRPDHASFTYRDRDKKVEAHFFRGWFDVAEVPKSATLYIAGPRHVRAFLNGQLVLEAKADPASPLNTHVFVAEVNSGLRRGKNLLAIEAERGYGIVAASDSEVVQQVAYGETVVAKMVAAASYREGATLAITDEHWRSAAGAKGGWQSTDFADGEWPEVQSLGGIESSADFFQWNTDAGMYDWPGYLGMSSYLRIYDLAPVAVSHVKGNIEGLESFTDQTAKAPVVVNARQDEAGTEAPEMLLDFGREVAGRILFESRCDCDARVELSYGESEEEALSGEQYVGRNLVTIPARGTARGPKSAFRYVLLRFPGPAKKAEFRSIRLEGIAYPVHYEGAFTSSDPVLNKIWETAAYTAHLCMQDGIWDAPKRDRGRWAGDLDATGPVITSVFGDYSLLEDTFDRLIPPAGEHVNGIPGYTALWISALADLYLRSGDKHELTSKHDALLTLLAQIDREFDASGHFVNRNHGWLFVDWSPDLFAFTSQANEGTTMEMVRGYERGAWLLKEMGDSANAERYKTRAALLSNQTRSQYAKDSAYGPTWQLNAMAVLSGTAKAGDYAPIWRTVFQPGIKGKFDAPVISPYFNGYVLDAMSKMGHSRDALEWIRTYWGGMLAEGATSFWEAYDPRWPKEHPHEYLQADGRTGFFVSLAHGWSSVPARWLQEEVLGVRPITPGYETAEIRPDLMGLGWVRGAVATPHGAIQVSVSGNSVEVTIPAEVHANLELPAGQWKRDGQAVEGKQIENGERMLIPVETAGTFRFARE